MQLVLLVLCVSQRYAWSYLVLVESNVTSVPGSWTSEPGAAPEAAIPVQLTRHFTQVGLLAPSSCSLSCRPLLLLLLLQVMQLAASTLERQPGEQHYFVCDATASRRARSRFSRVDLKARLEQREEGLAVWLEQEQGLTFPQLAHMVVEFHQDGLSLVFGCPEKQESDKLRELLKQGRQLEQVPHELREQAEQGWYRLQDSPPKFLTGEGKKIFNDLKAIFSRGEGIKHRDGKKERKKVKL